MDKRNQLLYLVDAPDGEENPSFDWYDIFMIVAILLSLIPLAFKETNLIFDLIDKFTVYIFILDYILRWSVADLKLKKGWKSFFIYPFTFMAILDLLTILPSLSIISSGFKLVKIVRLLRTMKIFRAFKSFRYSSHIKLVLDVIKKQKETLIIVAVISFGYILVSALIIFNVEPDSFNSFFDAIYWAVVSLTTVGYGDIYPVSTAGKIVTMISSFMGIAVVALPTGIMASGFMSELDNKKENEDA